MSAGGFAEVRAGIGGDVHARGEPGGWFDAADCAVSSVGDERGAGNGYEFAGNEFGFVDGI